MRPIQNNLTNLQTNQIAMEQAALHATKNKQTEQLSAQTAEEILKQRERQDAANSKASKTNQNGHNKSNSQDFKNSLYSKERTIQVDSEEIASENTSPVQINHIDFKA